MSDKILDLNILYIPYTWEKTDCLMQAGLVRCLEVS
jgi:hypothetical protein